MNSQKSPNFLRKAASLVVAAATLSVSLPAIAATPPTHSHSASKPPATSTLGTIVQVASANSSFKTLVAAVKAAGLVETLSGKGPFTVFAPTDAAFAALPKGTLEKLLKPENKPTLVKILTYHVVPGAVYSKNIKPGAVKTVEGSPVTVQIKKGAVTVGKAKVTKADVKASNGVIHVIDQVLLPPNVKL
jgi:uncharacterized surface protein with fasciclin (FAS1) repeats